MTPAELRASLKARLKDGQRSIAAHRERLSEAIEKGQPTAPILKEIHIEQGAYLAYSDILNELGEEGLGDPHNQTIITKEG